MQHLRDVFLEGVSMTPSLAGQIAVVTGAGRGIGAAISSKLSSLGAAVVACGRTQSALEATVTAIVKSGGRAEAMDCDVTDLKSVEGLARRIEKGPGKVDILVNNAGIGSFSSPLHELAPDDWDRVLNTNLRGVYYCIRSLTPLMMRGAGISSTFHRWRERTRCAMARPTPRRSGDSTG
jgi:NAD(P)-dependent dehydrogenase (short-subunit alcohol dehydrogenase family)